MAAPSYPPSYLPPPPNELPYRGGGSDSYSHFVESRPNVLLPQQHRRVMRGFR
jgi:hypothetical protein